MTQWYFDAMTQTISDWDKIMFWIFIQPFGSRQKPLKFFFFKITNCWLNWNWGKQNSFLFRMPNSELCFNLDKVPIIVSFKSSQHNQYFRNKSLRFRRGYVVCFLFSCITSGKIVFIHCNALNRIHEKAGSSSKL